jgi:hypothetical protein
MNVYEKPLEVPCNVMLDTIGLGATKTLREIVLLTPFFVVVSVIV